MRLPFETWVENRPQPRPPISPHIHKSLYVPLLRFYVPFSYTRGSGQGSGPDRTGRKTPGKTPLSVPDSPSWRLSLMSDRSGRRTQRSGDERPVREISGGPSLVPPGPTSRPSTERVRRRRTETDKGYDFTKGRRVSLYTPVRFFRFTEYL